MKILFLSHNFLPFIGGIEVISEMLCRSFTEAGHEVRLLTWSDNPDNTTLPFAVVRRPGYLRLLREHAWAELIFENNPCLRLSWPSLFFNRPSVIALHTWISRANGRTGIQDYLKLKWLKRAHKVIAVSNALRNACFPTAAVIGNPYRSDVFRIMPDVKRDNDFIFLGRLVGDKGVDLAIKAVHQLITSSDCIAFGISKPILTIVGDGPELKTLKNLVSRLNLASRVSFKGALSGEELARCLNRHRFLLVPSVWEEPFGIVALEGIACGCLPIVSDGGGLPDAVGDAGLTFRRGDVNSLVACIRKIWDNPELERTLRNAATSHLKAFQQDIVLRQYLNVIESVNMSRNNYESTNIASYK